jgi:uncharacterized cupin superfamily protein
MTKPILNIDEAQYVDLAQMSRNFGSELPAERFGGRMAPLGRPLGARKLGYNVTVVLPGKRAYPFHSHRANEEMFFVIEGSGEVRIGSEVYPLRPGDVIACPPGGPETAHQIVNTGNGELKYLAVSTSISPEVCQYPDSDKFGVLDGFGPGGFSHMGRATQSLDYWDGE